MATYGVIVQNKSVLVLVEVVKGALGDSILDFNAALDVLLVGKLHFVIDNGCLIPLTLSLSLNHSLVGVLHAANGIVFDLSRLVDLLIEGHWVVVLAAHIERRVAALHQSVVSGFALVHVLVLGVHQRHVFERLVPHRLII